MAFIDHCTHLYEIVRHQLSYMQLYNTQHINRLVFKGEIKDGSHYSQLSNGLDSGFQIPFKICTTYKLICFILFQIRTHLDFRSRLYLVKPFDKKILSF